MTNFHIKSKSIMSRREHALFFMLALLGFGSSAIFALWWFQPEHLAHNFTGALHSIDILLFFVLSYIVWYQIINELFYWFNAYHMRKIVPVKPEEGLSVAFLTAFVPQNEPYDVLERNLKAMVAVDYPHDTWLLDEGNDPTAKKICKQYGVKHFSRKGIPYYNTPDGEFKYKTKGGNYNAWFDQYGLQYHIVAQVDVDFVPKRNFLTDTLGYFRDPEVAFVGTPQIYGNQTDSWIARGAAEQAFSFYGPMQRGFNYSHMSLFIGANHVFRSIAHNDINGYAGHIVEDHLTGMHLYKKKWKSVYLAKVLAVGEGPATWDTYFNQQMRWAYGLFHILFNHSPKIYPYLRKRHLFNYAILQQYYFYGILQAAAVMLLSLYYFYGINATDMKLIPMITMYSILISTQLLISTWLQRFFVDPKNESGLHIRAKLLNIAVWPIYLLAFISVLTGKKITYKVTEKGSFTYRPPHIILFIPHLILGLISAMGLYVGYKTHHSAPHLIFFGLTHTMAMLGFFGYAVWENIIYFLKITEPRTFLSEGFFLKNLLSK